MYKPNRKSIVVPKITKFSELPKVKNGLYVFDIDETILVFKEVSDTWWKRNYEKIYKETGDMDYAVNKMSKLFADIVKTHKPEPTDIEGFRDIENNIGEDNNIIIFLTARPESLESATHRQIAEMHLKNPYPIYFSEEKGLKLKWILDNVSSDKYFDSIIFVDDKIYNIEDVQKECPQVQCFQFIPDNYIAKAKSKSSANATEGDDSSPK